MSTKKIILASASPRRKQLLEQAEIEFTVMVTNAEESYDAGLRTEQIPIQIAAQKANALVHKIDLRENIIIAADTIVVLENEIIGKPVNLEDAKNILKKLSGKTHRVITGVVILKEEECIQFYDITEVKFNTISKEQISHYVEKYLPMDKAGSYAIQEWIGVIGIQSINGCFYNVMGLPVSKVLNYL